MRRFLPAILTAVAVLVAGAASAATISSSNSRAGAGTYTLDLFDPSLGVLTGADLFLEGSATDAISRTRRGFVRVDALAEFSVDAPGFGIGASASDTGFCFIVAPSFCTATATATATDSGTFFVPAFALGLFVGPGTFDIVNTLASGDSMTSSATITYTFTPATMPIPVPAAFPALAGALGALGLLRRRGRA